MKCYCNIYSAPRIRSKSVQNPCTSISWKLRFTPPGLWTWNDTYLAVLGGSHENRVHSAGIVPSLKSHNSYWLLTASDSLSLVLTDGFIALSAISAIIEIVLGIITHELTPKVFVSRISNQNSKLVVSGLPNQIFGVLPEYGCLEWSIIICEGLLSPKHIWMEPSILEFNLMSILLIWPKYNPGLNTYLRSSMF